MELLDGRYLFLLDVVARLESGRSIRTIVNEYRRASIPGRARSEFDRQLWKWIFWRAQDGEGRPEIKVDGSRVSSMIFELLDRGFDGEPVLEQFKGLCQEVEEMMAQEIEMHLQRLPLLLLIPLLLFVFPAVMLVLVGPLILRFLSEV